MKRRHRSRGVYTPSKIESANTFVTEEPRLAAFSAGYTIVETLIYLAVTGALFVSAAILISGQQGKTEFQQTVREVESYIADVNNDISTGYYPNADVTCTRNSGSEPGPEVVSSGSGEELGTRGECLYLGRLLHFAPSGTTEQTLNTYTIIGTRRDINDNTVDATSLETAGAKIFPGLVSDTRQFSGVISFESLQYSDSGVDVDTGAFGFVSSVGTQSDLVGFGSSVSRTLAVDTTSVGGNDPNSMKNAFDDSDKREQDPGNIQLCIKSNASDQHAIITISASQNTGGVNTVINTGGCP
ncbi:MAG: hypothetical protein U5L95_05520 [Candidatus Saccharibacteria bacterium]|nr:hypothetical protein [Candidatus Saccharibacteria bacterium]